MQALTVRMGTQARELQTTSRRVDPGLVAGVIAIALAGLMVLAMLPGFARVPVQGPVVPAPMPAPAPLVVDSAW